MAGGTLTGPEIIRQVAEGNILIDPFEEDNVNPTSIDLTLGSQVGVYRAFTWVVPDEQGRRMRPRVTPGEGYDTRNPGPAAKVDTFDIDDQGWWVMPGVCYLMHTAETIRTDLFNPIVDGKSSFGRLFFKIHFTAGWGEPGFDGQFTLEVMSQFPVKVYPGQRVCQLRFQTLEGEILSYQETGRYTGDAARGAVGSRIAQPVNGSA